MVRFSFIAAVIILSFTLSNAQEPMTGDMPPTVIDSIQALQFNVGMAQATFDSLNPASGFASAAHRAAFYKAAAQLKTENAKMYSYLAKVDPQNKFAYLNKARLEKRQGELAMIEYYKALPSDGLPVIEHHKLHLSSN